MFAAVFLLALAAPSPDLSSWIPARWYSHDPGSLDIVERTPVNCLLLEQNDWAEPFIASANERSIATLAVIHPDQPAVEAARKAVVLKMSGIVLEGDFPEKDARAVTGLEALTIRLPSRSRIELDSETLVAGTYQGVWPGIQIQKDGIAVSAPSGAPWIDTNAGFLRFVRAADPGRPVWIANTPPHGMVIPADRYLQAIADAESAGAHWVIALDDDLNRRLLAGDAKALEAWQKMGKMLGFYASHPEWRTMHPHSTLALLEDVDSGALLAGGIMDMLAAKHTTVLPIPLHRFSGNSLDGATMAVSVDPSALTPVQRADLKTWTRAGNTLLTAPAGWKMPVPADAHQISLNSEEIAKLGDIWRELNSLLGSRNPGAKVYNAPGTISNVLAGPSGRPVVVQFVNYSRYPVEDVTVRLPGRFSSARLLAPSESAKALELFQDEGVTEVSIGRLGATAALVLE